MAPASRLAFLFFVLLLFSCDKGFAQTKNFTSQENQLAKIYLRLFESRLDSWDTTRFFAEKFEREFSAFIKADPTTLNYSFKKLLDSNYVQIKTSSDNNFRMYSWDAWTGGSMHEFNTLFQWKANDKVFTRELKIRKDDPGSFVSQIFTVDINEKPYYLAVTNGIYSNKDARQSVAVYAITNGKLIDTAKLFKTKTKRVSRIDVDFDFFSVVDRPERPLELITYDDKQKIIYIPVVSEKGRVTNRNILYQLRNNVFEFIGIETGKRK